MIKKVTGYFEADGKFVPASNGIEVLTNDETVEQDKNEKYFAHVKEWGFPPIHHPFSTAHEANKDKRSKFIRRKLKSITR